MMKYGIAALSHFLKNNNDRIPYFDIRYSLFDIRYSLFQSYFWPAAALTPETIETLKHTVTSTSNC